MSRTSRAGRHACRDAGFLGEVLIVDSVDAKRAFLHYPFGLIKFTRAIRARPGAEFAADASVPVDKNDSVFFAFVGRAGWANRHARCVFTMKARFWEMDRAGNTGFLIDGFERMNPVEPDTFGMFSVWGDIRQRRRVSAGIPLLAIYSASVTANANIKVDNQTQLFLRRRFGQGRHSDESFE